MKLNKYLLLAVGTLSLLGLSFCYFSDNQPVSEEEVIKIGGDASQKLLQTLKLNLSNAIKEKGVAGAVTFCNANALILTDSIQQELPDGVMIKRTSFRTRNVANEPDDDEIKAMQWFIDQRSMNNELPAYYIHSQYYGRYKYYNYYKPLVMEGVCLNCHGNPNAMDKKVVDKIRKLYPDDRAMGYKIGDFRGVIHVTIPATLVE